MRIICNYGDQRFVLALSLQCCFLQCLLYQVFKLEFNLTHCCLINQYKQTTILWQVLYCLGITSFVLFYIFIDCFILLKVRGDPDGCGLDAVTQCYTSNSELRVDLPAEDLLNIKKGWLMKQGLTKVSLMKWMCVRYLGVGYGGAFLPIT